MFEPIQKLDNPRYKQSGEYQRESIRPNSVSLIVLKNPTCLTSPMALTLNMTPNPQIPKPSGSIHLYAIAMET